jgi:hypothetical protein
MRLAFAFVFIFAMDEYGFSRSYGNRSEADTADRVVHPKSGDPVQERDHWGVSGVRHGKYYTIALRPVSIRQSDSTHEATESRRSRTFLRITAPDEKGPHVGGGQTAGGLPEYVVPNGPIPANATITHVP